ncbi:MAG: serine/threonine protein kinase [Betaproteobacteria bacterium]|nr:MAG: serine/threonine protein kinase [Betaproteobacteria bacterium]
MIEKLGRYEIVAELGQGAMGTVYKARDPLLDRIVAIKTISLNLPDDEVAEYEARFYQEAKAAGQLSHPNIVTIYDIGKSDQLAYMAMEFLEGQELRKILGEATPITIEKALDIGAQVADGLDYAHERQVVHRDIKPANVMVLNDGLIKITDFGIARMRNNEIKTMTGMILGSPKYMSPEQVAGKRADPRSDLFSLGVVIYEMLTGTSPFVADNIHGVMYQTLNFNPPTPKSLNPDLPEVVNYIIAKVLAKSIDDRYQSAEDLANDLRQARSDYLSGTADSSLVSSMPGEPKPFTESVAPLTRQEDKRADATGITEETTGSEPAKDEFDATTDETSNPMIRISSAFDSAEATDRLAAITGLEHEFDELSDSQKAARLKAIADARRSSEHPFFSASASWSNGRATARMNGFAIHLDPKLRYIWLASAALLFAAMSLLIFG